MNPIRNPDCTMDPIRNPPPIRSELLSFADPNVEYLEWSKKSKMELEVEKIMKIN